MSAFVRSVAIIAAATAASRLFGLGREVAIAHEFGASGAYDAFVIAYIIPHLLRKLLAEGALSAAFIPLFSERLAQSRELAARFASNVVSVALVAFPLIVGLGIWLAPHYVPFLADGFGAAKQALAVDLTRVTFPFIMLVGLAALAMGVLNSHDRFFAPAFAPVFFNVGLIVGALVIAPRVHPPVMGLALGVLLGGLGQLLFQLPFVRGRLRYRFAFEPADEDLRRLAGLMLPTVLGLIVIELNVLVDNKLASRLGDGAIASLQYAVRLFQLPLGVFAVSAATALLPRLSRLAGAVPGRGDRRDEAGDFVGSLQQGLRLAAFILLPATAGLLALGGPIIGLLFEHGRFTPDDTARTLFALRFLVMGLAAYGMVYLVTRAFYALQDTRTPVAISAIAVGVNIGLDLLLVGPLGIGGLALATSIAGLVHMGLLITVLRWRVRAPLLSPLAAELARMAWSAALMGGLVYLVDWGWAALSAGEFVRVGIGLLVGASSYGLMAQRAGLLPELLRNPLAFRRRPQLDLEP